MLRSFFVFFVAILLTGTLLGQGSDELKKKQAEIQREIDDLRRTLDATKKNKKAGLGQLSMIQKKIRLREQAIGNISEQIDMIQGNISKSRNEITRLKAELDTLKIQYEKSVVYAYKNRSNYDFLNFIFSASNFNDALKRVQYLKSYRTYREEQAENILNTQKVLLQKINGLEMTRKQKDEVLQKQEKEKLVLVSEKKEKDEIVSKLKARENELNKELSTKKKADAKIRSAVKAAINREIRLAQQKALEEEKRIKAAAASAPKNDVAKNNAPSGNAATIAKEPVKKAAERPRSVLESTPEGKIISDKFEGNKGKLPWPVDRGSIKLHFGIFQVPGSKINGNNPGLTIETEVGATVKAVFDGEVVSVFNIEGMSGVVVSHGKYFTAYYNLSSVSVSKGEQIKRSQALGKANVNDEGVGEIEFLLMLERDNINPEAWIQRR
ncbi:murein hydrolase activator EnvC family protein [Flavitalea sp.]|nr:peptidoglycan DD-metalloendopeptidase family protein [Flavitalea sp.]